MTWRKKVNPKIKKHLETRINQTRENKEAIISASNPKEAQLWCAIASLSKELEEHKLRITQLERIIDEKLIKTKKSKKELNQLVKSLNRL